MALLTEENDKFYGYKRDPKNHHLDQGGDIDMEFESINPYEFKKGMNCELNKAGVLSIREATEDERNIWSITKLLLVEWIKNHHLKLS